MLQELLSNWREQDAKWRELYKLCQDDTVQEDAHAANMLNLDTVDKVLNYAAMALTTHLQTLFSNRPIIHVRVGARVLCCETHAGLRKRDATYVIYEYPLFTLEDVS